VCKHGTERDVADTLDALHAGVVVVVDHDPSLVVDFDTDFLQVQALRHRSTTDSD
jgi:hypothetical protein